MHIDTVDLAPTRYCKVSYDFISFRNNRFWEMVQRKTEKNPNLVSVLNAAWRTFALYVAVNLVALGWTIIFHDVGGDYSLRLHNLSLSINGEVVGLTWRDTSTKILLLIIFLALIFRDFVNGRARLQAPESMDDEGLR